MFQPTVNLLEILVRVVIVYVGLSLLLRLTGKKELAQLAPMDFLAMLIVSETISPALTAGDSSVTSGLFAAAILLGATFVADWASYRSTTVARLLHGRARAIIRDGRIQEDVQRAERLTKTEIEAAVRRGGVEDVADVKVAYVETTGHVSVIPKDD